LALAVGGYISGSGQAVQQAERLEYRGIDTHSDRRIASLYALQRRPGREGAIGHDRHRQVSADTGVMYVGTELPESPAHTCGGGMRGSHLYAS
jgi:hypothetical protein